jgi:hypothetical protein
MPAAMTFEDYIRTQIDLRALVSVRLGLAEDGTTASLMTWSNKSDGTCFWDVEGDRVTFIDFIGKDESPKR